jgi:hypothetical protein
MGHRRERRWARLRGGDPHRASHHAHDAAVAGASRCRDRRFTAGKSSGYPAAARLGADAAVVGNRRDLRARSSRFRCRPLIGAGELERRSGALLWRVASSLGSAASSSRRSRRWRARTNCGSPKQGAKIRRELDAYRVLGVRERQRPGSQDGLSQADEPASSGQTRRARAAGVNGPLAEQKTHEIRAAYERIKAHRGRFKPQARPAQSLTAQASRRAFGGSRRALNTTMVLPLALTRP